MIAPGPDLYRQLFDTDDALEIYRGFYADPEAANLGDYIWSAGDDLFALDDTDLLAVCCALREDAVSTAIQKAREVPGKFFGVPAYAAVVYDDEEDAFIVVDALDEKATFYLSIHELSEVARHMLLLLEEWEPA